VALVALAALVSTPLVVPPPAKRAKLSPAVAPTKQLSTVCAELSKLGAATARVQKCLLKKMCRVYFDTYEPDIDAYFAYRLDPTDEKRALAKEHMHLAVRSARSSKLA
jgi:hypothetical protein